MERVSDLDQHSSRLSKVKGNYANRKPLGGFPYELHCVQHCISHGSRHSKNNRKQHAQLMRAVTQKYREKWDSKIRQSEQIINIFLQTKIWCIIA